MIVSAEGRTFIEGFEGLRLQAYRCPAGVPTIGYGHTRDVRMSDVITQAQADELLSQDLLECAAAVTTAIGDAPTTQHQFDAMVSLTENIGAGGFAGSTVLRLHKKGDHSGADAAFSMWNKAMIDGRLQEVPGLTRRRAAEAAVYLTPEAAPHPMPKPVETAPMPQAVQPPKTAAQSKTVIAGAVAAASTAGTVADQITTITAAANQASDAASSVMDLVHRFGPVLLAVVALCAIGFVLWRYVIKRNRGEVVST